MPANHPLQMNAQDYICILMQLLMKSLAATPLTMASGADSTA
jgi:hypothetical protein